MKVLSLFDGVACGRVALQRAGIPVEVYDAYEIDPNAIKVATHNFPDINEKGDVCKAKFMRGGVRLTDWRFTLPVTQHSAKQNKAESRW